MWWPSTLVQVSLFRALHEKEEKGKGDGISRAKFFLMAVICSFCYYIFPGYLFSTLSSISWVCWVWPNSVTAQQIGSGMNGLGFGAFSLDWSTVASFLFSPVVSPFFTMMNVFRGYFVYLYIAMPIAYWGINLYNAKSFPIFSSDLFTTSGQQYDITNIVNDKFKLVQIAYAQKGPVHLSMFIALSYGFGFASIASTVSHVTLSYGR